MTLEITLEERVRRWMREAVADAQLDERRGKGTPLLEAGVVQLTQLGEAAAAALGLDLDDEEIELMVWDTAFDVSEEIEAASRWTPRGAR